MSKTIVQDISIGENLRALRLRAGFSQEQVASQLQIIGFTMSREIISQMELGKHHIKVSILLALAQIYDAAIDEFFNNLTVD